MANHTLTNPKKPEYGTVVMVDGWTFTSTVPTQLQIQTRLYWKIQIDLPASLLMLAAAEDLKKPSLALIYDEIYYYPTLY